MPRVAKLHCQDCNHVWEAMKMTASEKWPDCPNCSAPKPQEGLAAPRLNRGAKRSTKLKIPDNKTKAIDQAMRWASEDNGGANIRTDARMGEPVAMPVPTDPRVAGLSGFVGSGGNVGSINVGSLADIRARTDPTDAARNLNILGGMTKKPMPLQTVAAASMKAK